MVVACRTQQLIKTGKNVSISRKFSFSIGSNTMGIRNYTCRNTVPHSNKVRLCDCKRFHSSIENRTTLAKLTPQELFRCPETESRSFAEINGNPIQVPNESQRNFVEFILTNQGTSFEKIDDVIAAADGNVELAIAGLNSELHEDLYKIEDGLLKVNPESAINIMKNTIRALLQQKLGHNPALGSIIEKIVNEKILRKTEYVHKAAEESAVPLEVAKEYLGTHLNRNKRSLQPRGFDITQIVTDIVFDILRTQFGSLINEALNTLKNVLSGLYEDTPTGNDLGNIFTYIKNTVVKRLLEIITAIQTQINSPPVQPTISPEAATEAVPQTRKLALQPRAGLLDGLLSPLTPITGPINSLLKGLVSGIFDTLGPVLGDKVMGNVKNLINALIDLALPANNAADAGPANTPKPSPEAVSQRRKRDVALQPRAGLLDGIVTPLTPITGPINSLLKGLVSSIFDVLGPVLGDNVMGNVKNLINAIIDLALPA